MEFQGILGSLITHFGFPGFPEFQINSPVPLFVSHSDPDSIFSDEPKTGRFKKLLAKWGGTNR